MTSETSRKAAIKRARKAVMSSKLSRIAKITLARSLRSQPKKSAIQPKTALTNAEKPEIKPVAIKAKKIAALELVIIELFGVHKRLKPAQIAQHLNLEFERDSEDRALITAALKKLTKNALIVNNGGQYVQPYRAQSDHTKDIPGVVTKGPKGSYVQPADPEIKKIYVDQCNVPDGSIVTVRRTGIDDSKAVIVNDYGLFESAEGLCKLTALKAGIPMEFPTEVLEEVAGATVPPISDDHKDLRQIPFLTIDPDTAKDFDDAICVRKHGKNTRVMVAIADVGHYVKPGMHTYDEAMLRGNSTYLPGYTVPMLPEALSNGLCSLQPKKDRAAYVMTVEIDPDGNILKYESTRAIIHSRARLTYEQVQDAIEEKTTDSQTLELYNKYISKAYDAYKLLLQEREQRGALALNVKEQRLDVTRENGLSLTLESGNEAHGLIEESMILANRAAIAQLMDANSNVIVRAHGGPNPKALTERMPELENLGMVLDREMNAEEMVHDIATQAIGHKNSDKIRRILIRVQAMAGYKAEPSRHFALALDNYGHFTSPIRRAADLAVHHLLQGGQRKYPNALSESRLTELAEHWNKTERRSEDAERECHKRIAAKWVQGNMKSEFNASVVAIGDQEITVRVGYPSIITDIPVADTSQYKVHDPIQMKPIKANAVTGIIEFSIVANASDTNVLGLNGATDRSSNAVVFPRMKAQRADPRTPIVTRH